MAMTGTSLIFTFYFSSFNLSSPEELACRTDTFTFYFSSFNLRIRNGTICPVLNLHSTLVPLISSPFEIHRLVSIYLHSTLVPLICVDVFNVSATVNNLHSTLVPLISTCYRAIFRVKLIYILL